MSSASEVNKKPIESKKQLVEWFESGATPAEKRLVGVEHEKIPFYLKDNAPVPYEGKQGRNGMQDFLSKMVTDKNWQAGSPENGKIVDLHKDNMNWTFEPGLQMETGGAPLKNIHQIAKETDETIKEAVGVAKDLGFGLLALGYNPTAESKDLPQMPKSRYAALRDWIEDKKFPRGNEVLTNTATVQVNLGYVSEEDMVKMLRVSLALQPVAVALFANSPFAEGKPTGYQSYRSHTNFNSLGGRYGFMLPIAFDKDFGFEKFVDYALNSMPMLGVYKGNVFIDAKGGKFQDFIDGKLEALPGQKATLADWQNHVNTIWPEVRVRKFLEMRGTDVGPQEMIKALPAFWVGLLYDKEALDKAYEMVKDWTNEDRDYLRIMTPQHGLQTPFMGTTVQDIAKNVLALSEAGLKRRNILNEKGEDESVYLAPLHEIAETGRNWAQRLLDLYNGPWNRDINQVYKVMNYENNPSVFTIDSPQAQQAATPAMERAKQHPAAANDPAPASRRPGDDLKAA